MSEEIEFTSNYSDLSTDKGFQFEFNCNRCSNGFRTRFQPWAVGSVSSVLDAAGSLLGGVFSDAADVGERVRSAGWQKAHDEAFSHALTEIRPNFVQCPRCSSWVCRKACWNTKRGLCKDCSPDLGVEMSAAQASRSVEEVWAHAKMSEEDKKLSEGNWRETIVASCPKCGAPQATNAKFCPECGTRLKQELHCSQCGAKLTKGAKFCPECGAKTS
jgi:membrane protease subunit (stomatin/prohibitin family)